MTERLTAPVVPDPHEPAAAPLPRPHQTRQHRLDGLLTRVAVELMPVSATSLDESLAQTLRVMSEFFEVDTSFLRRNDFDRDVSVLVAEGPPRENAPQHAPRAESRS